MWTRATRLLLLGEEGDEEQGGSARLVRTAATLQPHFVHMTTCRPSSACKGHRGSSIAAPEGHGPGGAGGGGRIHGCLGQIPVQPDGLERDFVNMTIGATVEHGRRDVRWRPHFASRRRPDSDLGVR